MIELGSDILRHLVFAVRACVCTCARVWVHTAEVGGHHRVLFVVRMPFTLLACFCLFKRKTFIFILSNYVLVCDFVYMSVGPCENHRAWIPCPRSWSYR